MFKHFDTDREIQDKVKKRLKFLYTDCMGLAYMLTPEYAANGFYFEDDQTDIIGYVKDFALKMNSSEAEKAASEMLAFVTKMSTLNEKRQETIFKMSAKDYWNFIGRREFPVMFKIAKPIIEMICSSATSERTWSTFKFIHSRLRNRLTNERVNKLVFLYTNCALLDEKDKNDYILEDGAVISGEDCEETVCNTQND